MHSQIALYTRVFIYTCLKYIRKNLGMCYIYYIYWYIAMWKTRKVFRNQ